MTDADSHKAADGKLILHRGAKRYIKLDDAGARAEADRLQRTAERVNPDEPGDGR